MNILPIHIKRASFASLFVALIASAVISTVRSSAVAKICEQMSLDHQLKWLASVAGVFFIICFAALFMVNIERANCVVPNRSNRIWSASDSQFILKLGVLLLACTGFFALIIGLIAHEQVLQLFAKTELAAAVGGGIGFGMGSVFGKRRIVDH